MFHSALYIQSTHGLYVSLIGFPATDGLRHFDVGCCVWGLRNSNIIQIFEKIAQNYAKLIGQHVRSFAHGVPLKGRSDPRGLVAAP